MGFREGSGLQNFLWVLETEVSEELTICLIYTMDLEEEKMSPLCTAREEHFRARWGWGPAQSLVFLGDLCPEIS